MGGGEITTGDLDIIQFGFFVVFIEVIIFGCLIYFLL